MVGVQCKGKDANYGKAVSEDELRQEVEKTQNFKPALSEFILVTTAPDDVDIQQKARLIEQEVRAEGRRLSIAVWGWNTLEQHISEHYRALKAFHPDATPVSDKILENEELIIENQQKHGEVTDEILTILRQQTRIPQEEKVRKDLADKHFEDQINQFRALIQTGQPKTSLRLLEEMKCRVWNEASQRIKFRILANIGAAHHTIGDTSTAANCFLEAYSHDPDNPVAIANKIVGLLLQERREDAAAQAIAALQRFPANPEISLQRLQAIRPKETIEEVWESLHQAVRTRPEIIAMRIVLMRDRGQVAWRPEAEHAANNSNDDWLRQLGAEAILDHVLDEDPLLVGAGKDKSFDEIRLKAAADTLKELWEVSHPSEGISNSSILHSATLAFVALRDFDTASKLADDAIEEGVAADETKKLRVMLLLRQGQKRDAIELVRTISTDPERELSLAQLFVETEPAEARRLVNQVRPQLSEDRHRIAAAGIIVECFIAERNWQEAISEAKGVQASFSNHPAGPLFESWVLAAQGSERANDVLREAFNLIAPDTDFSTRYILARSLFDFGLHEESAKTLEDLVDRTRDSSALRLFLSAAINADRRVTVADIMSKLPASLAEDPFYARLRVALAQRSGNLAKTEAAIRGYLSTKPRSLEIQLQFLQVLLRQDKIDSLVKELGRPFSDFDGDPEEWMQLALFLDTYGSWQLAHSLAYRTWVKNQTDPIVNLRYVGVFVRPSHSDQMPLSLDTVEPNTAIGLCSTTDNREQKFVIEPDSDLRILPYTIAPGHAIAIAAMGRQVGDRIDIDPLGTFEIRWIKPKQLDALHHVMESFNLYFPDNRGLLQVTVKQDEPNSLQFVFDKAKERHDEIQRVFGIYEKSVLPIELVGRSLGSDSIETFLGLVESSRTIRICEGSAAERAAAFKEIEENNGKGCVVDGITLHIILGLELQDIVQSVCGPIGIVDRTVHLLQQKRFEVASRLNEPDLSVGWHNGQVCKTEVSVEDKKRTLSKLERDIDWLKREVLVLETTGTADIPEKIRGVVNQYSAGFADEFLSAQENDLLLLSEDMGYRIIGNQSFALRSSWLQPILMVARDRQILDRERYSKAVLSMIDYGSKFVSIDTGVLLASLRGSDGLSLPRDYIKACNTLGGPNADLQSQSVVILQSIVEIWNDDSIAGLVRRAAVSLLFRVYLQLHSYNVSEALSAIRDYVLQNVQQRGSFLKYLDGWLRGHFLTN